MDNSRNASASQSRKILTAAIITSLMVFASVCNVAVAAEPAADSEVAAQSVLHGHHGLAWVDWAVIVIYAISTILLGLYYSRKQESTNEYFVGSGNMNWFLIGVSLFATLLSTITYLALPGEMLGKGPMYMSRYLALPIVYYVVGYGLLPVYMRHRVTSAYALLEEQLGVSLRLLAVVMFLLMRLIWMALLIYLTSKAMTVMMGVDESWIPIIVMVTGSISVAYTTLGGMRAVVITDLVQTILLLGGAMLVPILISYDFGGFGWFPKAWQSHWDPQPFFSFDPKTRVSVVGMILSVILWDICTSGGDQVSVQRFMATRDAAAARKAFATQQFVNLFVGIVLALAGLALLGYFQSHPDFLPQGYSLVGNADDLFPRFIAYHLPVGVSGLVMAGMFAAAMSSVDSGVNSITAVVMTDLLERFQCQPKTERGQLLFARFLALAIGTVIILSSSTMGSIPGNITAVTSKTVNLLTPHLFALFVFALFVKSSRPLGVWLGAIAGVTSGILIAFSGSIVVYLHTHHGVDPSWFRTEVFTKVDPLTQKEFLAAIDPVSFIWIGPVSLSLNLGIGYFVSQLMNRCCPLAPSTKTDSSNEVVSE